MKSAHTEQEDAGSRRNNLMKKLSNSKWRINARAIRATLLSLTSVAELHVHHGRYEPT